MTNVGAGGVIVARWQKLKRFHKDYSSLETSLKDLVDSKLQDLTKHPMPPGLRFEKLKGYSEPDIFSIHINGSFKVTMEIQGQIASLRRVGNHDEIDRAP
jgi:plasmid maintenance system killer protein